MLALWTAFDLTAMEANVTTALVIGVTITLLFVAYKLIKRSGRVI
jgi:hypothetical protein